MISPSSRYDIRPDEEGWTVHEVWTGHDASESGGHASFGRADHEERRSAARRLVDHHRIAPAPRRRAAVHGALSRLARRGSLLRVGRGLYVCPLETRFGLRAPSVEKVARAISQRRGEIIVTHGAAAANSLGLTTQVPIRTIYLTNGRSRQLRVDGQIVEFRHAPAWQLLLADRLAGDAVRALAWLGPEKAQTAVGPLERKLGPSAFRELISVRPHLPDWLARALSQFPTRD